MRSGIRIARPHHLPIRNEGRQHHHGDETSNPAAAPATPSHQGRPRARPNALADLLLLERADLRHRKARRTRAAIKVRSCENDLKLQVAIEERLIDELQLHDCVRSPVTRGIGTAMPIENITPLFHRTVRQRSALGSKVSISSGVSPRPINLTGLLSCSLIETTTPPRAVPSSLARMMPVTPMACWKFFA